MRWRAREKRTFQISLIKRKCFSFSFSPVPDASIRTFSSRLKWCQLWPWCVTHTFYRSLVCSHFLVRFFCWLSISAFSNLLFSLARKLSNIVHLMIFKIIIIFIFIPIPIPIPFILGCRFCCFLAAKAKKYDSEFTFNWATDMKNRDRNYETALLFTWIAAPQACCFRTQRFRATIDWMAYY